METRIALIGIIVEDPDSVQQINAVLHEYGGYIVGRMGLPYREKKVNIISVVVDAENNVISSISGKLGMPTDFIQGMTYLFVRACVHFALFEDEDYLQLQLNAIRTSLRAFIATKAGSEDWKAGGARE